MRTSLLAFVLVNLVASAALAQTLLPPVASVPEMTDGPLLAPPAVDVAVPAGAPLPPPANSEAKNKPRFFRLPSPQATAASQGASGGGAGNQPGRLLNGRWKQRNAPPLTEAPPADSSATLESAAVEPDIDPPPPKRTSNPRKYGPLELFPKAKESDRGSNPFSLRKPLLAW
jgi:hypothetical protein